MSQDQPPSPEGMTVEAAIEWFWKEAYRVSPRLWQTLKPSLDAVIVAALRRSAAPGEAVTAGDLHAGAHHVSDPRPEVERAQAQDQRHDETARADVPQLPATGDLQADRDRRVRDRRAAVPLLPTRVVAAEAQPEIERLTKLWHEAVAINNVMLAAKEQAEQRAETAEATNATLQATIDRLVSINARLESAAPPEIDGQQEIERGAMNLYRITVDEQAREIERLTKEREEAREEVQRYGVAFGFTAYNHPNVAARTILEHELTGLRLRAEQAEARIKELESAAPPVGETVEDAKAALHDAVLSYGSSCFAHDPQPRIEENRLDVWEARDALIAAVRVSALPAQRDEQTTDQELK